MPRPQKTKATPIFSAPRHALSAGTRAQMIAAMGRDDSAARDVLAEVEKLLGAYGPNVENIERQPATSLYATEFTRLARKSLELANDLLTLGGYFKQAAKQAGVDTDGLADQLANFHEVAAAIARRRGGRAKAGPRGNVMLRTTIQVLRTLFSLHERGMKGRKRREEEFVRAALVDARIVKPEFDLRDYMAGASISERFRRICMEITPSH